ncbi:MAG: zinc-binding dehydrogenase, partial [Sphingopyxis sp.]
MNRQCVLRARPTGVAQAADFALVDAPLATLPHGHVRVQNRFLSVEPAMRGWIADTGNYAAPVAIGAVMRALAAGIIIESRHGDYAVGDWVIGWFGWQEQAVVPPDAIVRRWTDADLSPSLGLGVLGINGVTAHLALTGIGQPRGGETIVISTAAGAVGSAVGQIATLLGCRAVGITGGAAKVRQCVQRYGYAAAVNYKDDGLAGALGAACPDGVDIYFDNTARQISDTVYPLLNIGARVVVCGT